MGVAGRLLVATPPMDDPNFERSVVLMLSHDADGAFGLVISKPHPTNLLIESTDLSGWLDHATPPATVFEGGPVQQHSMIGLARLRPDSDRSWANSLTGDLHTVDLASDAAHALECERLRLFVGYSGWGASQLDGEIAAEHWFVVDSQPDDAFDNEPHTLWRRVLERDPTHRDWVRSFPDDPNLN